MSVMIEITRENFTIRTELPPELAGTVYQKGQPRSVARGADVLPAIPNAPSKLTQLTAEICDKLLE